jgi:feruloyl-CoA synthase
MSAVADFRAAPFRAISLGPVDIECTRRPDGSLLLRSRIPLADYPARLTDRLEHWAKTAPERVFLARRGKDGRWITRTYAETLAQTRTIAQALLDRGLSAERPVCILSENGIEHALLSLACLHVGVPFAPVSPAYSLLSTDFGKLRICLEAMQPGLVFTADGTQYEKALRQAAPGTELAVVSHAPQGMDTTPFEVLLRASPTAAVERAHDATGPETVAKVLFTSGSTGVPKGVITTQRMLCSNLQQIGQCFPCIGEEPPVFMDWLPWNHVFGGNHNFGLVLYNGGTLYIDDGRPTPAGLEQTVANLREIAPTVYLNVPRGFADLVPYLRREPALREKFFSRLKLLFYGGAGLPQPVWDALDELSVQTLGRRTTITSGLGMTESSPSAVFAHWSGARSGDLGVPVSGLTLKLAPVGEKLEARYRGPNVTPGYWKRPELNAACFDEEGFFRTGDAVQFLDASHPEKGIVFDGRIAENFKLSSGTWVTVGAVRAALLDAFHGLMQDAVLTAPDRDYLGVILFPAWAACRSAFGASSDTTPAQLAAHPQLRDRVRDVLASLATQATGSSNRVKRAVITSEPPSIDVGEVTDKGSINQGAVLRHRAALVASLYDEPAGEAIIGIEEHA